MGPPIYVQSQQGGYGNGGGWSGYNQGYNHSGYWWDPSINGNDLCVNAIVINITNF